MLKLQSSYFSIETLDLTHSQHLNASFNHLAFIEMSKSYLSVTIVPERPAILQQLCLNSFLAAKKD